jgi:hypothetical protein
MSLNARCTSHAPRRPQPKNTSDSNVSPRQERYGGGEWKASRSNTAAHSGRSKLETICTKLWEFVHTPGTVHGWQISKTSRAMPLTRVYDSPTFTAPRLTDFHVTAANQQRRQKADDFRACQVDYQTESHKVTLGVDVRVELLTNQPYRSCDQSRPLQPTNLDRFLESLGRAQQQLILTKHQPTNHTCTQQQSVTSMYSCVTCVGWLVGCW